MLNSRSWIYDIGLALLSFTTSKDYGLCQDIMRRMEEEQAQDGSFCFSSDLYIGTLFDNYTRTGSMGWLIWGMCYYTITTGDTQYTEMIEKAGQWLLSRQITNQNDFRYGLLTGGYGSYNEADYSYTATPITWCSTEHQLSSLQALYGLTLVSDNTDYDEALTLLAKRLVITLYDSGAKRFYQGCNENGIDGAWALDCTTWAGLMVLSLLDSPEVAAALCETAYNEFYVAEKYVLQSTNPEYYNTRYSISGTTEGFKPYRNSSGGYANAPEIAWSEGTLGYAALCVAAEEYGQAEQFLDAVVKMQVGGISSDKGGILYATETHASLPWEFHVWPSFTSSAWFYLLIHNPKVLFGFEGITIDTAFVGSGESEELKEENSPLVVYTQISPNSTNPRNHAIDTITIHCMAGNLSVETCGNVFAPSTAGASSNYGIGTDGRIAMYVEEKNRSWCSSSASNDHRAVTIEVANNGGEPDWPVSEEAYIALLDLVTDICKRNDIKRLIWEGDKSLIGQVEKQNMTVHRWFAAKACPGDYLYNLHSDIVEKVNKRL